MTAPTAPASRAAYAAMALVWRLCAALVALLCLNVTPLRADAPQPGYMRPGTPQVGGVRHICLIYGGNSQRPRWSANALLPYVAYVDEAGKPRDWLFDSFLFIEPWADSRHVYSRESGEPADAAEWEALVGRWSQSDANLGGLEAAVAQAGEALGDRRRVVSVVIALPTPFAGSSPFGVLPGMAAPLDFVRAGDRERGLAWYIQACLSRWRTSHQKHLRLAGFYWQSESIGAEDEALVKWTSSYLHRRSLRLYWIPFAGAGGVIEWRQRGIDAVMMQPNLFFAAEYDPKWLVWAVNGARLRGCGIEMEFDGRLLTSPDYQRRFRAYLDAGARYGWMRGALVGYYEGGGALGQLAASPGVGRRFYRDIYRFVKGTYQYQGTKLPPLAPPPPVAPANGPR